MGLFTDILIEMMPNEADVVAQANASVVSYALIRGQESETKSKRCGCSACQADYEASLDLRDWVLGIGDHSLAREEQEEVLQPIEDLRKTDAPPEYPDWSED